MANAQHSTKSTTLPVFDSCVTYTPADANDTIAEHIRIDAQHSTKSTALPVFDSYLMCTPADVNDVIAVNPMFHYQLQCQVCDPSYYFPEALSNDSPRLKLTEKEFLHWFGIRLG